MPDHDLFTDWPGEPPSVAGSATSIAAAKQIEPVSGALRLAVYRFVKSCQSRGATDEEIQDALRMPASTQRPRRVELVQDGWVRDSNKKRPTRSGRAAVVWVITEKQS